MKWYKHLTNLRNKSYIIDAMDLYGHQAYSFYTMIHEIYGENYNETDKCGQLTISMKNLRFNTRLSEKKIKNLFDYFQIERKILHTIKENEITIKIPDFIELASNWTKRKEGKTTEVTQEEPQAIEERSRRKNKILNNNIIDDVDKINNSKNDDYIKRDAKKIIEHLNKTFKLEYKDTKFIEKRIKEGENPEDFYFIIERMKENDFFRKNKHLYAPKHLFKKENLEVYLNN